MTRPCPPPLLHGSGRRGGVRARVLRLDHRLRLTWINVDRARLGCNRGIVDVADGSAIERSRNPAATAIIGRASSGRVRASAQPEEIR